jgi:hypothetical protein
MTIVLLVNIVNLRYTKGKFFDIFIELVLVVERAGSILPDSNSPFLFRLNEI